MMNFMFLKKTFYNRFFNFFTHFKSDFFLSTSIIFVNNIISGIINYILIILVSRNLVNDYSIWTALLSLTTIITTFYAGYSLELTKKISTLSSKSLLLAFELKEKLQKKLQKYFILGLILTPLPAFLIYFFLKIGNFQILLLIFITQIISFYSTLSINFLLASVKNWQYSCVTITSVIVRFAITLLFLYNGFFLWALPLGLIFSTIISYLLAEFFLFKIKSKNIKNNHISKNHIKENEEYSIRYLFFHSLKSSFVLFILTTIFNIIPILSEKVLQKNDSDLVSILFTFGQIMFFGATAFVSSVVIFAVRNNQNHKILKYSLIIVTILSFLISILFYFGSDIMLNLVNRKEYLDKKNYILWFSFIVFLYNIVFVIVQYFLSKNWFNKVYGLFIFIIIQFLNSQLIIFLNSKWSLNRLDLFLYLNTFIMFFAIIWLLLIFKKK